MLSKAIVHFAARANTSRLTRVIDEMRRLIEKYPSGYKDWARQGEAAPASTAQTGPEAKAKTGAAAELDQSLQPGAPNVVVADAIASIINGPAADFEAPGIHEKVLSIVADTPPANPVKAVAEAAVKEQAPVAQAPRKNVILDAETVPASELREGILDELAAGAENSKTDVTSSLKRPPTVPIPLPFATPATSPLARSTPAVADHPTADSPSLAKSPSTLLTLPATRFNPAAAPTLSVTPPTPLTPRGPRATVESPLIDSPGHQPNILDPVAELPASVGEALEDRAAEPALVNA